MSSAAPPPTERLVRNSARAALYLALLGTGLAVKLLLVIAHPPAPLEMVRIDKLQAKWIGVDFAALPEVQLLREYVGIDTSEPDADELAGAEFLAAKLAAAGLTPHIERFAGRRANLWAFVEGEDPRAVVLAGHIDVEPAKSEGEWKYPPFGGVIEGPWMYGRGIYDMKSLTIAQLLATVDVANRARESGRKPRRSVLFLATSGEEIGSETGTRWILRQHPELVARMGLVLTEGGVVEGTAGDEVKYWGIEFAQKRFTEIVFCSSDEAKLLDLRSVIEERNAADPTTPVSAPVALFLSHYARTRGLGSFQSWLANAEATLRNRPVFDELTPFMKALFSNELVPFPVEPDPAGGFRMRVFVHLLPEADRAAVLADLLPESVTLGYTHVVGEDLGARIPSPVDSADFRALARSIEKAYPGVAVGPYFLPWTATDSRFFREAGIPSYGFSPFLLAVTDTMGIARANERMPMPGFVEGVAIYRDLLRTLTE
jgi:acetylornithine deacetylase/succinyl-diaminopimelate desuccinylase-like protein